MPHCPAVSIMDTSGLKGSFEISNLSASWSLNQVEELICDEERGGGVGKQLLPWGLGEAIMKACWSFKGPFMAPVLTSISVADQFLTHRVWTGCTVNNK